MNIVERSIQFVVKMWNRFQLNEICRHIPSFVSGVEPQTVQFRTQNDLLNIDWVKGFKDGAYMSIFLQYSMSDNHLVAEYSTPKGRTWYVIGTIKYPDRIHLPEWSYKD